MLFDDALESRDPKLAEASLPLCTEHEVEGYVWASKKDGTRLEEPVKENDHGCDAMRYAVCHVDKIDRNPVHFSASSPQRGPTKEEIEKTWNESQNDNQNEVASK
jgi:phage terminase large subunit